MAALIGLLLLPAIITAVVWYLKSTWWAGVLFFVALIPPIWVGALVIALFNGAQIDGSAAIPPIIIAVLQILALWCGWYAHDPKAAGEALAIVEGASAAYDVKKGHPVLGAVTGVGAVSQWQYSASQAAASPAPVAHQEPHNPEIVSMAQGLRNLANTYLHNDITDQQLMYNLNRIVAEAAQATRPPKINSPPPDQPATPG